MGGYAVHDDEAVVVDAPDRLFEVAGAEALAGNFLGRGGYHDGEARCLSRMGPTVGEGPGDVARGF